MASLALGFALPLDELTLCIGSNGSATPLSPIDPPGRYAQLPERIPKLRFLTHRNAHALVTAAGAKSNPLQQSASASTLSWSATAQARHARARKENDTRSWNWPNWAPQVIWVGHECPRCTSTKFKPAEMRSFDGLLGILLLRPVRCTFCWRRYYWFALRAVDGA